MTLFARYWRRPRGERTLLLHALALHGVVALLFRFVAPSRAFRWLRLAYPRRPVAGRHGLDRIAWAIRTATTVVSAGRTCLTEAVTAECLLRRDGYDATLRFGVAASPRAGSRLRAHAWVEHAGATIIGADARYAPLQPPGRES